MLVLSRKNGQSIHIGRDIIIRVVQVRGSQVRIGIEAPGDVAVVRSELREFDTVADIPRPQAAGGELCVADFA